MTFNPIYYTTDKKVTLEGVKFINNANSHYLGFGAVALDEDFDYQSNAVSLTVNNCEFESNHGGKSSAIGWEGVELVITNTSFSKNSMETGAAVTFNQYY